MPRPMPILLLILPALLLPACSGDEPDPTTATTATTAGSDSDTPTVYTTFYPVAYFTERIAGDAVNVELPLPDDADPIFYSPSPEQIERYQQADLIVTNGAHFEKWVEKTSLPPSRLVRSAEPFADNLIRYEEAVTHTHGPSGEHTHEGIDGHTWLDPNLAKQQAAAIRDALIDLLPDKREQFEQNYDRLAAVLDVLDGELRRLSDSADTPLLASHPAYNYLARRYGWNIHNLDLDPAAALSDEQLDEIEHIIEDHHPARIILWEERPLSATAERLESELGITSVVFSPCEMPPEAGDYLTVMNENIEHLRAAWADGE